MSAPERSSRSRYRHQKLTSSNKVRLLRLYPAGPSQSTIDGELHETDLIRPSSDPHEFHAVSWCWGKGAANRSLRLRSEDKMFSFPISENLESALRGLRYEDQDRLLWIDAICIDQDDITERNEQVPKMDQIYGQAVQVCIWLGEGNPESKMALDFIKSKVLSLWKFDELCENTDFAPHWAALIRLMSRPWFSRRWVVQEIALTRKGTLQCGREVIDWQDFADAVSLFVEVESATHRLSEVMKKDETFNHIPDFFGHVPALGAALLVDATSNLFRSLEDKEGKPERKPLSSLEYLVSRLSVFEATQPRDTIYALLAIAKDTTPQAKAPDLPISALSTTKTSDLPISAASTNQLGLWAQRFMARKIYHVDYGLPVVEVYKDFIDFSIRKSNKRSAALDIICRPWARRVKQSDNRKGTTQDWVYGTEHMNDDDSEPNDEPNDEPDEEITLPSWIPSLNGAAWVMNEHVTAGLRMERKNADSLVGLPTFGDRTYSAAGTKGMTEVKQRFKKRENYYSMFVEGFILDEVEKIAEPARLGNIPFTWLKLGEWKDPSKDPPPEFWRTLVADRGPNGRNPPTFYARACKESVNKVIAEGSMNTKQLIDEGRCSIVAEFLRRVQAVIWNRSLIRTKENRLGLIHADAYAEGAQHMICILYGCSVPVLLRKVVQKEEEVESERVEDMEFLRKERAVKVIKAFWNRVMSRRWRRTQLKPTRKFRFKPKAVISSWPRILLKLPRSGKHHVWRVASFASGKFPNFSQLKEPLLMALVAFSGINLTLRVLMIIEGIILLLRYIPAVRLPRRRLDPKTKPKSDDSTLLWYWWNAICNLDIAPLLGYKRVVDSVIVFVNIWSFESFPLRVLLAVTSLLEWPLQWIMRRQKVQEPPCYWVFLGECYVEGMMNGEAIALQNERRDGYRSRIFELR